MKIFSLTYPCTWEVPVKVLVHGKSPLKFLYRGSPRQNPCTGEVPVKILSHLYPDAKTPDLNHRLSEGMRSRSALDYYCVLLVLCAIVYY